MNNTVSDKRRPEWLKMRIGKCGSKMRVRDLLNTSRLHTVCEEAKCPNMNECHSEGTATFLILGDICTRNCRFCSVKHGVPDGLDSDEPVRVAEAVSEMGLDYVVITSVTRDDLEDQGCSEFVSVMAEIRKRMPDTGIELLVPDFRGEKRFTDKIIRAGPQVFNHNIESVPSVFSKVRPEGSYLRSLRVLEDAAGNSRGIPVKSGFMVGFGETKNEVFGLLKDLSQAGVSIVTIGQYLQPSREQVGVSEYVHPDVFREYREKALSLGFRAVYSSPFVRSS